MQDVVLNDLLQHAEIVRLQSQVDTLSQEKSSAESRLEAVRKARQTQETQLENALRRVTELQAELTQQTTSFRAESETQKRLADLMDRRNEESRRRLEEIEQEWDAMVAKTTETEARLKEELSKERHRNDDLENRLVELRMVTDTMRPSDIGTPGAPRASTPTPGTPGSVASNSFFLSPAANLAIRLQKSGRSYTEIYADYVKVNEELIAQKEETRRLESALAQILTDIEERVRSLLSREKNHGVSQSLNLGSINTKSTTRVFSTARRGIASSFAACPNIF
jgi:nucleoprotein TPR